MYENMDIQIVKGINTDVNVCVVCIHTQIFPSSVH